MSVRGMVCRQCNSVPDGPICGFPMPTNDQDGWDTVNSHSKHMVGNGGNMLITNIYILITRENYVRRNDCRKNSVIFCLGVLM